ncbi:hypothetical protein SUGI_0982910 [Cryptomeria japonica]|uniref:zinc-finger homeodomain protein 7 n=1 Tax=Cryptomeria japonica TaxID=3369 RepID=UPI002414C1F8|nr:zinc-finger homeodomain protein 7 [Cryptomeria japonica]GLJ46645.1 hypothetical protein SUGI_0982910 [Cryptomeria japonica]
MEKGVTYRECMKNHAAGLGMHATDGCGEFMASTESALKCAACHCHRNFHRREEGEEGRGEGGGYYHYNHQPWNYYHHGHMASSPVSSVIPMNFKEEEQQGLHICCSSSSKKRRFKTKFSQEQKAKMLQFAHTVEWKMPSEDDAAVQCLCEEVGVSRQVLKVWMNNNRPKCPK